MLNTCIQPYNIDAQRSIAWQAEYYLYFVSINIFPFCVFNKTYLPPKDGEEIRE
jgi:hypothetical protein